MVPRSLRVKRLEVVEVAATVRTERTSAEVVPKATLSVKVWRRTKVPSSWNPDRFWVEDPQSMLPELSVVRAEAPEQLWTVDTLRPPAMTSRPRRVFVAELVCKMLPPVIVSPEAEESPPLVETEIPPAKVLVAVELAFRA